MLVSSLITVLGLAFVVGILYHYFQGQLMGELKKEAVYISRGVESAGTDYLKKLNDEGSSIEFAFTVSLGTNIRNDTHYILSDFRRFKGKYRILRPVVFGTKNCKVLFLYQRLCLIKTKCKSIQILVRSSYFDFLTRESCCSRSYIQKR